MPVARVRKNSLTIHEVVAPTPNSCSFTVEGTAPLCEQAVVIHLGDALIFQGTIDDVQQDFDGLPTFPSWRVSAVDGTRALNRHVPFGAYVNESATDVILDLWSRYAPVGFTADHIQSGMPAVTMTFNGDQPFANVLTRIMHDAGGLWRLDYENDLHAYLTDVSDPPETLTTANLSRALAFNPHIVSSANTSQLRNRVYIKGGGTHVAAAVPAGALRIPVDDINLLPPSGDVLVNGQIVHYPYTNAVHIAARGVPPIVALSLGDPATFDATNVQVRQSWLYPDGYETAPSAATATFTLDGTRELNMNLGAAPVGVIRHVWFSTETIPDDPDWSDPFRMADITDNTQTLATAQPDAAAISSTGTFVLAPDIDAAVTNVGTGSMTSTGAGLAAACRGESGSTIHLNQPGGFGAAMDTFELRVSPQWYLNGSPTITPFGGLPGGFTPLSATLFCTVSSIHNHSGTLFQAGGDVGGSYGGPAAGLPALAFGIGLTERNQLVNTNIVSGAPAGSPEDRFVRDFSFPAPSALTLQNDGYGVTIWLNGQYCFTVGGTAFLEIVLFKISGNYETVGFTHEALPVGMPTRGDTRLAVELPPNTTIGQVFCTTGGTARLGGTLIEYTGIDEATNELTGIPEDGPGSLSCDHSDDGLGSGDTPTVECDIVPVGTPGETASTVGPGVDGNGCEAGTGTLILETPTTYDIPIGADINLWVQRDDFDSQAEFGIRECPVIDDSSIVTVARANARGDAELLVYSQPIEEVRYATRDPLTAVGKVVDVNMTDPPLVGSFKIQDITISQIDIDPEHLLGPLRTVQASSMLFTLDDLLRKVVLT